MPHSSEEARKKKRFRAWWRKRRKAILARRRKKYRNDPAFRERAIQRSRQRYWQQRPEIVQAEITAKVEPSFSRRVGKRLEPAYGLADVAKLFGRNPRTVQFWIERSVLPKPLYRAIERHSTKVYSTDEFALLRRHASLLVYPKKSLVESVFARTVRREMAYLRRGLLTIGPKESKP